MTSVDPLCLCEILTALTVSSSHAHHRAFNLAVQETGADRSAARQALDLCDDDPEAAKVCLQVLRQSVRFLISPSSTPVLLPFSLPCWFISQPSPVALAHSQSHSVPVRLVALPATCVDTLCCINSTCRMVRSSSYKTHASLQTMAEQMHSKTLPEANKWNTFCNVGLGECYDCKRIAQGALTTYSCPPE